MSLLLLVSATGCDRMKAARSAQLAELERSLDSIPGARDSLIPRKKSTSDDSLFAIREVQRLTDSLMRLASPDLAPPGTAAPRQQLPAASSPAAVARGVVPTSSAAARALPPLPPSANSSGRVPVTTSVDRNLNRAQALGDSIASAQVDRMVAKARGVDVGDTVRGVVRLDNSGPGSRPVLMVNQGRTTVGLSGLGIDGLAALAGAEVMVRGVRVTPHDVVVSAYTLRAVNGIKVLDGKLAKSGNGAWTIELSDHAGTRKLSSIPAPLQAAEGARVWIAENPSAGQTYGVIARR